MLFGQEIQLYDFLAIGLRETIEIQDEPSKKMIIIPLLVVLLWTLQRLGGAEF